MNSILQFLPIASNGRRSHRRPADHRSSLVVYPKCEQLETRAVPATFLVTNLANAGAGSLRQAMLDADANGAAVHDDIVFHTSLSGTIVLSSEIKSFGNVTLVGNGKVTISGNNASRIFDFDDTTTALTSNVTIQNLILTKGKSNDGGAIRINDANLTLENTTIKASTSTGRGGGVSFIGSSPSSPRTLNLTNSSINNNTAATKGGGIYLNGGNLELQESEITGNFSNSLGGGAYFATKGSLTGYYSNISNNYTNSLGGGVFFFGEAKVDLNYCTISGNDDAGLMLFDGGSLLIQNSTFDNNYYAGLDVSGNLSSAKVINSTFANNTILGLRLYDLMGTFHLFNSTVSHNGVAGIFLDKAGNLNLVSSIIAKNTYFDLYSNIPIKANFCAIGSKEGVDYTLVNSADNLIDMDFKLGTLTKDPGAKVATVPLLADSPAIDTGINPLNLSNDQRGFQRETNFRIDIGAYEFFGPPVVKVQLAPGQTDPSHASTLKFIATFDQPVTGFDPTDIVFTGSTQLSGLVAAVTPIDAKTYQVDVTGMAQPGFVKVSVLAGGATASNPPNAGTPNQKSTNTDNFLFWENDPPVPVLSLGPGQDNPTNKATLVVIADFGETVFGFTPADLDFTGTTAGSVSGSIFSLGSGKFQITISGATQSGVVNLSIPAGSVVDQVSLPNLVSNQLTIQVDKDPPTVTINQSLLTPEITNQPILYFDVVFSEPVVGFDPSKISFAGSTAGGTLKASVTGSGTTYVVAVSGMTSPGFVVATVELGAATDLAGNLSFASTSTDNVVFFDNIRPDVLVTAAAGQKSPTNQAIVFDVNFSRPVVGFTASDVSLAGSTVGGKLAVSVSGSGQKYQVTVTGMDGQGKVQVSIIDSAALDIAGNASLPSNVGTVLFDNLSPMVTVHTAAGQSDPTYKRPVVFDVIFTKPVTGFDVSDLDFSQSTAKGTFFSEIVGSGTKYQVFVYGISRGGEVVLNIKPGAATDLAGNLSLPSTAIDNQVTILGSMGRFAVGAGVGGGPRVKVYESDTGTLLFDFFAYEPTFRGGVHVTQGDVNGDGVDDIITTPAAGGGPLVKVFDGLNGQLLAAFYAYDPNFFGGVFAAVTDVNNDGFGDIIVGAGIGGGPHIRVFSGKDLSDLYSFFAYDMSLRDGVTVAGGDINSDGFGDLIIGAGPGGGPHVKVFSGRDLQILTEQFPFAASLRGGIFMGAGDVNGDGRTDVIVGSGGGAAPGIAVIDGNGTVLKRIFLAFGPNFDGGVRVTVADVNGDGFGDIIAGAGLGGGPLVRILDGKTDAVISDLFAFESTLRNGVFVG